MATFRRNASQGFALPTIVIASVVMFAVLAAVASMVASARVGLDTQYYESLAMDAAESGAARAAECLESGSMMTGKIITNQTDCSGTNVGGRTPYTVQTSTYRTSYTATLTDAVSTTQRVAVTGQIERLRTGTSSKFATYKKSQALSYSLVLDPEGDRPTQRYWYFGKNVILDFGVTGSNLPVSLYNSKTTLGGTDAGEGTTVITDKLGNMLFWTDGGTVWDKNGTPMANSYDAATKTSTMKGAYSGTQAVASFPLDQLRTKYAIVSNSSQAEDGPGELYLSVVDMTKNSGSGAVDPIQKNIPLSSAKGYSYEGLSAMPNVDGSGYYVYTANTEKEEITAFLIKYDNATNTPLITGPFITKMTPQPVRCSVLYANKPAMYGVLSINFTKDYKKMLVMASATDCPDRTSGTAYLYSTDAASGNLTNIKSWKTTVPAEAIMPLPPNRSARAYTADFSPEEKYVYVSSIYPSYLTRYNIQNPTADIAATAWQIGPATTWPTGTDAQNDIRANGGGQIRRGPDNRMYIADRAEYQAYINKSQTRTGPCRMSYINNPDAPDNTVAAIGLKLDAITIQDLGGSNFGCSRYGLPQMVTVFKPKVIMY